MTHTSDTELTLQMTTDCPLACEYCYAQTGLGKVMSLETVAQALTRFAPTDRDTNWTVGFFGGEPLMELDRLQEMVALVGQANHRRGDHGDKRLTLSLTTNGVFFTDPVADWMKQTGFEMGVSLDGTAAMHNTHRRMSDGGESHSYALDALRRAIRHNISVQPNMVVTPTTVGMLADSFELLAYEEGCSAISITPDLKSEWDETARNTMRDQLDIVADSIEASFRAGRPVLVSAIDGRIRMRRHASEAPVMRCRFGRGKVSVAVDGSVFPCEIVGSSMPPALTIGHVDTGLEYSKIDSMKHTLAAVQPACQTCENRGRCEYWCGCRRFLGNAGLSLEPIPDTLCFFEMLWCTLADDWHKRLTQKGCWAYYSQYYVPTKLRSWILNWSHRLRFRHFMRRSSKSRASR
jgi:uncharacterized protein